MGLQLPKILRSKSQWHGHFEFANLRGREGIQKKRMKNKTIQRKLTLNIERTLNTLNVICYLNGLIF